MKGATRATMLTIATDPLSHIGHRIPFPDLAMKTLLPLLFALSAAACAAGNAPSPASTTSAEITTDDLRHRLFLIADDSMMGRESGSEGDFKTAAYVAAEFKRLGLEPAGDNGTYFQTVPFWNAAIDPQSRLEVNGTTLTVGRDFVPANIGATSRSLDGVPTIYGGPMTDSTKWIPAAQAAGKIVVLDLPPGTPVRGIGIGGPRWRGAVAIAAVLLDVIGAETVARLREGRPVADTSRNPNAIPMVWLTRKAAATILGADPATLTPGAAGAPLRGRDSTSRAHRCRSRRATSSAFFAAAIRRCADSTSRSPRTTITSASITSRSTTIRCARSIASSGRWAPTRRRDRRPRRSGRRFARSSTACAR